MGQLRSLDRRARDLAAAFVFALIGISVAIAVTTARPAAACSCARTDDAQAFARADAVFVGVLTEIRTPPGRSYSSADPERFVFEVSLVHKGQVYARQSVVTARDGASCGLELIPGTGRVLVFARVNGRGMVNGVDGELTADLCNGTTNFPPSQLPASFGAGTPPLPGSSPIGPAASTNGRIDAIIDSTSASPARVVVLLVIGAVLVLGVAAGFAMRRQNRRGPDH